LHEANALAHEVARAAREYRVAEEDWRNRDAGRYPEQKRLDRALDAYERLVSKEEE